MLPAVPTIDSSSNVDIGAASPSALSSVIGGPHRDGGQSNRPQTLDLVSAGVRLFLFSPVPL